MLKAYKIKWLQNVIVFCFVMTLSAVVMSDDNAPSSCKLTTLDGVPAHNLQALHGKVVYVDFWASWCPPCVKSFPFLSQLDHDLKDQGLQVIGVNLDEKITDAETFLDNYPVDFDIALDPDKQCAKDFGVIAMPSSYLIDRKGVVRHVHQGFRPDEAQELRHAIEYLLSEPL